MPKVSIVVPVYNTKKYLEKCLDSLVYQTLDDIEIIVVNDGSPDESQKIIDRYVQAYPNKVQAYVKENGGLSDARNFGISKCNGEYIGFVDSDDYVNLDMYQNMYNKAKEQDFDMVVCDIRYVYENVSKEVSSQVDEDINDLDKIKAQMVNIYPAAWNKIYKKKLFENGVLFKKGVWYEDVEFLYRLFPYIKSIGTIKKTFVNYVQRDGAITRTFDERVYNYIDNFNGIVEFYKAKSFYDEYYSELEYSYVRYLYMTFIKTACNFDKKEYKKACKLAKKNVLEKFPNYKQNKYIQGLSGFYLKHFNAITQKLVYTVYNYKNKREKL